MSFDNCTQAYQAGRANIPQGDPAYAIKLDRDHDGVACEKPPANFRPAAGTQAGTSTSTGLPTAGQLPKTGPGTELGAAAAALLVLGVLTVALFRRRRTRFTV
jgi:LPXTG-motif cell wall-anchored protein